jgi:hypothetical protein
VIVLAGTDGEGDDHLGEEGVPVVLAGVEHEPYVRHAVRDRGQPGAAAVGAGAAGAAGAPRALVRPDGE